MKEVLIAAWLYSLCVAANASEWRADIVPTDEKVTAIEISEQGFRAAVGKRWFRLSTDGTRLELAPALPQEVMPKGGLPDGRVATGRTIVAKTWFAEPTKRYTHGVLGDAIEAGSLSIERRDGTRRTLISDETPCSKISHLGLPSSAASSGLSRSNPISHAARPWR